MDINNKTRPECYLTKEQSLSLFDSKFWENMSYRERAIFQINEARLCMPFSLFVESIEETIGRSVFDFELLSNYNGILREIMNGDCDFSYEKLISLIPVNYRSLLENKT